MEKSNRKNQKNKYNAKKTTIDGITFSSKSERFYYEYLKQLKQSGEVKSFDLQPSFILMDKFKHPTQNKTVRAIKYVADFKVEYADGSVKIIDVKGKLLPLTAIKIKLFMNRYGLPLVLAKYNYSKKEFTHVEY